MTWAAIGLGSNLGRPGIRIARALSALRRVHGVRLLSVSSRYASAPIGGPAQPDYVNCVAIVETSLAPRALLARLQAIERGSGRRRDASLPRNGPRTLDLDLLLYGRRRMHDLRLTLPHPRMHERAFVLHPLAEVAPAATIPGRGLARRYLVGVRGQSIARLSAGITLHAGATLQLPPRAS